MKLLDSLRTAILGPRSPLYKRWLLVGYDPRRVLWSAEAWAPVANQIQVMERHWHGSPGMRVRILDASRSGPVPERTSRLSDLSWCVSLTVLPTVRWAQIELVCPSFRQLRQKRRWAALYLQAVKPFRSHQAIAVHLATDAGTSWDGADLTLLRQVIDAAGIEFAAVTQSTWTALPTSKFLHFFLTMGFNYRGGHEDRFPDLAKVEGEWQEVTLATI